jgi:hypothetical protein
MATITLTRATLWREHVDDAANRAGNGQNKGKIEREPGAAVASGSVGKRRSHFVVIGLSVTQSPSGLKLHALLDGAEHWPQPQVTPGSQAQQRSRPALPEPL